MLVFRMGQFVKVFVVKAAPTAWSCVGSWVVAGLGAVVDGSGVAAIATGGTAVVEGMEAPVVAISDSDVVVTTASTPPGATDGEAGAAEVVVLPSDAVVVDVPPPFRGSPT
jgi:hypothetical protein